MAPKVRVRSFAVSIDGFGAGPNQDLQNPIGVGGLALMEWFFETRSWRQMHGLEGGETGTDDDVAADGLRGIGAWILGRKMFGPVRGPWPDDSWKGWWGDEPASSTSYIWRSDQCCSGRENRCWRASTCRRSVTNA
jgi:dihydrofolate reductase